MNEQMAAAKAVGASATAIDGWAGPLAGVRVLDFTRVLAGPFLTQILADLGAEVHKVEAPGIGDETRTFAPHVGGESHYFLGLNRHKKSLVIDLKTAEGVALAKDLARRADVVVENFRPGVMDRLGLGYEALSSHNERLVYCAVSGFGMSGPLRDKPSFDIVTQAMSGALSVNGEAGAAPVKLGLPLGDMVGGIWGSIGVLAALHERATTGQGRLIDISLHDGLMGMLGYLAQIQFVTGKDPKPVGTNHPNIAPYGAYPASDGTIIIACLIKGFWLGLCKALDRPDLASDPRFGTAASRIAHRASLDAEIAIVTRQRTVAEWEARLAALDVPHAPILGIGAALSHPHSLARDMVVTADHPGAGQVRMVGRPIKFPGTRQRPLKASPLLGEHTEEVLRDTLGLSPDAIAMLRAEGIIDRIAAETGAGSGS